LLLIAAFDAREGAYRFGLPSTARWLGYYCGLSQRTAIEHVRVARALAAHPPLADAMSNGWLSFSQVRAISRVAELGARLVEELIQIAEHGTVAQLEDTVRGLRTVDSVEHPVQASEREAVTHRWREDSLWGMSAKLDPEHGALVQSAIDTVARREGLTQPQALTRIAEIALATLNQGAAPAPTLRGDEHAAIVVHLDAAAVPAQPPEPDNPAARSAERTRPTARIAHGCGLPDTVVQRLACTGRVRTVLQTRDGQRINPLDIGASRRLVTDKQYRALLLRDGGCTHPGCLNHTNLEAHHVRHWLDGGPTIMANLVLLCRRHHHALHDGQFRIVALGHGRFRFDRDDGKQLARHIDPWARTNTTPIDDEHPNIAPDAATTRWDGSRLNRDYAVTTLAQFLVPIGTD
jgi:hypothetical protein